MEKNEDGGYTVTVPSLPGCISEGSTWDEALAEIEEAIFGYIELQTPFSPRTVPPHLKLWEL